VWSTRVKNTKEYGKTLTAARGRLVDYLSEYQDIFRSKTKKFFDKAQQYTRGVLVSHRCNIEQISDNLHESDYFQLQHFISDSNWSYRDAIDVAARQTSDSLRKVKLTGLILDETGTEKKGDRSVGVGHQYCGNVGKTANSQVAVMACLSNGDFASMVDARLYLPKDWCDDPDRCEKAGIPEQERSFKTKIDLAYEIVRHQIELGTSFDYIGADGFYGNDCKLASKIDQLGLLYMFDTRGSQALYLEKPEVMLPVRKSNHGPQPRHLKVIGQNIKVAEYLKGLEPEDWEEIKVRKTAKGTLRGSFHFREVHIWNKHERQIERRLLVIRKMKTKSGLDIKYSFTNANLVQYTSRALAYMQAQRFFIEHCIKEAKYVLGMDQFQTRKWLAWHHQVALNIMIMCFMLKEKLFCFKDLPLLSARNIKDWLCFNMAKEMTESDMRLLIFNRHRRRQYAINVCYFKENANVSK
jgi:SRSO17 transposase